MQYKRLACVAPLMAMSILAEAKGGDRDLGTGMASFYGRELMGNRTANGERFDPDGYTAAHRTLSFGSRVRVINLANDKDIIVRINDRGPWKKDRIIDLSYAAAKQIGMHRSGTAKVRLELVSD